MSVVAVGQITLFDQNDSPVVSLSNDAHPVPCAADGTSPDLTGAISIFQILLAGIDITNLYSVSVSPSSGITGSLATYTYTVDTMTVDTGYVDFIATRVGFATLTKRFSLSKMKQGITGETGPQGIDSPACLGLFDFADRGSITGMVAGSLAVLFSTTVEERGIYAYISSTWTRQSSPTPDQISRCFLYILDAVRQGYGVSSHYIGSSGSFEVLLVKFLYLLKMRLGDSGAIFSGGYDEYGTSDGITPGAFIAGDGRFKGVGASFDSANITSLSSQEIKTLVDYFGSWSFGGLWPSEYGFVIGNASHASGWGLVSTSLPNGQAIVLGRASGGNIHASIIDSTGNEVGLTYLPTSKTGDVACFSSGRAVYVARDNSYILRFIRETSSVWGSVGAITAPGYIDAIGVCELSTTSVLVVIEALGTLYEIIINEDGTYSGFTNIGSASVRHDKIALERDLNGNVVMVYTRYSDNASLTATRNTSGVWSAHSGLTSGGTDSHALMIAPNGTLHYYFRLIGNPATLKYRIRDTGGSWGAEVTLFTTSIVGRVPAVTASMLGNGKILIAYTISINSESYYKYRIDNSYYSSIPTGTMETQVGAGIIEVGQNSNGTYIKFSDGTLIQYQQVTTTIPASSGPSGGIVYQYDFAIPNFVGSKPCLTISASEGGPPPAGARFEVYSIGAETNKWGCAISNNWASTLYAEIKMMAIGRWK